jgi:hypothetical protein
MSELREMQIIAACPHDMCKSPPPFLTNENDANLPPTPANAPCYVSPLYGYNKTFQAINSIHDSTASSGQRDWVFPSFEMAVGVDVLVAEIIVSKLPI